MESKYIKRFCVSICILYFFLTRPPLTFNGKEELGTKPIRIFTSYFQNRIFNLIREDTKKSFFNDQMMYIPFTTLVICNLRAQRFYFLLHVSVNSHDIKDERDIKNLGFLRFQQRKPSQKNYK